MSARSPTGVTRLYYDLHRRNPQKTEVDD